MTLLPLAVRLATTFLQKPDIQYIIIKIKKQTIFFLFFRTSNSHLNSKSSIETNPSSKEESVTIINTNIKGENKSFDDTVSSNNYFYEFEQTLSSSSERDLSIALQSLNYTSSLSLTTLDNQDTLLPPTQTTSDNESVLYLRLSNELNIVEATLDSDLDRIER